MSFNKHNSNRKIEVVNPGDKRFEFVIKEYRHRNIDSSSQYMILYTENDYIHTITLLNERIRIINTDLMYCCIRINNIIYLFYLSKEGNKLTHIEYTNQDTVGSKILEHPNTTSKVSLSNPFGVYDNLRLGGTVLSPIKINEIIDTNNKAMILLEKYSILYIVYKPNKIDIKNEELNDSIKHINSILEKKNLRIVLDFVYNIDRKIYSLSIDTDKLILCLMKKSSDSSCNNTDGQEQCISSITFNFYTKNTVSDFKEHIDFIGDNDIIAEISSFTKPICEKRSYNTLLRSILISILHLITYNGKHIIFLLSIPIKNISKWLLVSSYYTNLIYINNTEKVERFFSGPKDFKGIKSSNIFENAMPSSNKNIKNINTKTKKNTNNKSSIISKYKPILKNVKEIYININPINPVGIENIDIANQKIEEFISK